MSTLPERFWKKVAKSDGCWNWTGMVHPLGYAKIKADGGRGAKPLTASRVSYELNVGSIPPGLSVLHRCDNKICVRPDHLFLGTLGDNNRDRWHKNRDAKMAPHNLERTLAVSKTPPQRADFGASNVNAKMTEEIVTYARLNPDNLTVRALAEKFGVNTKTMHEAIIGRRWRHVATPPRIRV